MENSVITLILKSPEKFYQTKDWKRIRSEVLARDHNECRSCKEKSPSKYTKAAIVHHKQELKTAPLLALSMGNLESLCFNCHEEAHGRCFMGNTGKPKFFSVESW